MEIFVDNVSAEEAVDEIIKGIRGKQKRYMVTPNAEIAYHASKDDALKTAVNNADIILPDGAGVVFASRFIKNPLKTKTGGAATASLLLDELNKNKLSLFILGGTEETVKAACENVNTDYPNIKVSGCNGYFTNDTEIVDKINSINPDTVFVCLGSPKQELFMHNNFDKINTYFLAGLGGTVDILAKKVKHAPAFFIKLNIEWLYRLLKSPKRFFRMLSIPLYLFRAVLYRENKSKEGEK